MITEHFAMNACIYIILNTLIYTRNNILPYITNIIIVEEKYIVHKK